MRKRRRAGCKGFALVTLFTISFLSLGLGLFLCLVKSPAAQSDHYLSLATHYVQQADAEILQSDSIRYLLHQSRLVLYQALQADPYNGKIWKALSLTLAKANKKSDALRSHEIAVLLGQPPLSEQEIKYGLFPERAFILSDNQDYNIRMR